MLVALLICSLTGLMCVLTVDSECSQEEDDEPGHVPSIKARVCTFPYYVVLLLTVHL